MHPRGLARVLPFAVATVLLLLLAVLAILQYRWVGELSDQERERMRSSLLDDASGFAREFDLELGRAFSYFNLFPERPSRPGTGPVPPALTEEALKQHARWMAEARYPGLLRGIFYIRSDEQGRLDLRVLWPEERRFEPCPWPPGLQELRQSLLQGKEEEFVEKFGTVTGLLGNPPGILSRNLLTPRRDRDGSPGRPRTETLMAWFDQGVITGEILPDLTRCYFGNPWVSTLSWRSWRGNVPKR